MGRTVVIRQPNMLYLYRKNCTIWSNLSAFSHTSPRNDLKASTAETYLTTTRLFSWAYGFCLLSLCLFKVYRHFRFHITHKLAVEARYLSLPSTKCQFCQFYFESKRDSISRAFVWKLLFSVSFLSTKISFQRRSEVKTFLRGLNCLHMFTLNGRSFSLH